MAKIKDIEVARKLLSELEFCVFDLESTGGNHKSDKIIEVGLVRVKNLKIVEKKNYLVNPEIKIPEFIQKLTSIKQDDVKDAPVIQDIIDEVLDFMGDSILVAHNTSFDVPFFNSVLKRLDRPELTNNNICTNLMTKYLIPNLMSSNLTYMSKIFNITHSKAHRALDDAEAAAELLINYLNIFIDKNIKKVNHLYYPRNRFELDRANFKKAPRYTGKRIISDIIKKIDDLDMPFMISLKGDNGIIMFALPCKNSAESIKEEKELLLTKLESLDWKTATIRLYGPFLECVINYNSVFCKLPHEDRVQLSQFLWNLHFPSANQSRVKVEESETCDFIVLNHLVPEQYIIYPTQSLNPSSALIFRYPAHKKKFLQFIKSRVNRMNNKKLKKAPFSPELRAFVDHFLQQSRFLKSGVFQFNKDLPQQGQEQFVKEIEGYLNNNSCNYNYPSKYI